MAEFSLSEETNGYVTLPDPSNTDPNTLIGGSQNMLIDANRKMRTRGGYTRLGAANTSLKNNRNAWTWKTSTGQERAQKFWDTNLQVFLGTIDGTTINDWTTVYNGFSSTEKLRSCIDQSGSGGWFDSSEALDVQVMVQNDVNIYDWSGGVAVVSSAAATGGNAGALQLVGNNALLTSFAVANGVGNTFSTAYNSLAGTSLAALLALLSSQPANNDTLILTINGTTITITFVSSIGAAAGNVLIGASVAATIVNLLGLLNSPSTSTGNHIALSAPNQTLVGYLTASAAGSLTKAGTSSWSQNRFYSSRSTYLRCVRTGKVYSYIKIGSDVATQTLQAVAGDLAGLVAGDILVQMIVTRSNLPTSSRKNSTIANYQNQIALGSESDNLVYLSKNTSYYDFAFSSPRIAGEGSLFTLTDTSKGITTLGGFLLMFAGSSTIFKAKPNPVTVGSTLTEPFDNERVFVGVNQGSLCPETIVPIGNMIAYLSNEVACRVITDPNNLSGIKPATYSNPIKPDFDAEIWKNSSNVSDAFGTWFKNILMFSAAQGSRMYMLNFVETADGKTLRYWNPPQILPIGPMTIIDLADGNGPQLYGHSNGVPESYLLFDGLSDGQYANMAVEDKLPIHVKAITAYNNYKKKALLKTMDEYYINGEIIASTTHLTATINYDFDGATQQIERVIDGSDETILEGLIGVNSLAQQSLGNFPLGSLLNPPVSARKFSVMFELAKEDFFQDNIIFETNDVDQYWAIIFRGGNVSLSPRKPINIRK